MADASTTNQSFTLVEVGASEDTWGGKLNANWTALDTLLGGLTATEFTYLDGVTSAIQTQIDAKFGAPGGTFTGPVKFTEAQETVVSLSGTTPDVDLEAGTVFTLTTSGDTTFTFSNPAATGTASRFTLEVTSGGSHTITWPASVRWPRDVVPTAPASGDTDVFVFWTRDGGTTWNGRQAANGYT